MVKSSQDFLNLTKNTSPVQYGMKRYLPSSVTMYQRDSYTGRKEIPMCFRGRPELSTLSRVYTEYCFFVTSPTLPTVLQNVDFESHFSKSQCTGNNIFEKSTVSP